MSDEPGNSFTTDLHYKKLDEAKNIYRVDVKIEGKFTYSAIAEVLTRHLELLNRLCKENKNAIVITIVDFENSDLKTNFWELLDLRNEIIANFTHYTVKTILVHIKDDKMVKTLAKEIMDFITNIIDFRVKVNFFYDRKAFEHAIEEELATTLSQS